MRDFLVHGTRHLENLLLDAKMDLSVSGTFATAKKWHRLQAHRLTNGGLSAVSSLLNLDQWISWLSLRYTFMTFLVLARQLCEHCRHPKL